ncbi:MAG: ATP cone domain-containing protein, partial [Chthoniobacterales bacterium]|nr:ATP cone domain-containing protein [Chthoniobacterales bacterium]
MKLPFSFIEEDLSIKNLIFSSPPNYPRFSWSNCPEACPLLHPSEKTILIQTHNSHYTYNPAEVAEKIGQALTDLLLSRNRTDIFTEANRLYVAKLTNSVTSSLLQKANSQNPTSIPESELIATIEKTLLENDAHDIARSFLARRSYLPNPAQTQNGTHPPSPRLIRRNGTVVPWNPSKIEIACRKAFLSIRANPEPAVEIANAVTERARNSGLSFIHIEDVQDWVQEELMRQGHYKVAESYILYRAHRALLREQQAKERQQLLSQQQHTLLVVKNPDGSTHFWDGSELKKRIQFASIGLDLCLSQEEIERELRRSLTQEISAEALRQTILLNAKTLIERDADFARFAGRILLTYIYEEVLPWNISSDGIERLKEAHRLAFKNYIRHGIQIERLTPSLLEFNLDRLADALDPSADLDFDYLGIQTLYDRYLIVDKTNPKKPRRIETPQFFWMRVAMGLFLKEPNNREDWTIRLYNLYKSRRFCSST